MKTVTSPFPRLPFFHRIAHLSAQPRAWVRRGFGLLLLSGMISGDGLHPNDAGMRAYNLIWSQSMRCPYPTNSPNPQPALGCLAQENDQQSELNIDCNDRNKNGEQQ
jgi:hypothetical protein